MQCKFELTPSQRLDVINKTIKDCPLDPEVAREGLHHMISLCQNGLVPGRSVWFFPFQDQQPNRPEFSNRHGCWIHHPEDRPLLDQLMESLGIQVIAPTRQGLRALTREYRKKNAALDKKLARR